MYPFFRSLLFRLYPETAHGLTIHALGFAGNFPPSRWFLTRAFDAPPKPVQAFGLTFKNPVGIAAGYDKNAVAVNGLAALGFGHVEVGTVTPRPQPGNPKPRSFRLVEDEGVINRLGFPSQGADFVERRLLRLGLDTPSGIRPAARNDMILGVNLGKNKDTLLEEAAEDYIKLMKVFAPLSDYLTINISSPNTVGLRRLQGREMLEELLGQINVERGTWSMRLPVLVKIAPDLNDDELDDAIGVILDKGMDGVIATNTTLARDGLKSKYQSEAGGLSGRPLAVKSEAVLSRVVKLVNGKVPIISVGGIMSPNDAKTRLALGASLIQVYTGLVYRGPGLVREIVKSL
jgi:dihydroorotate dehydrogenase